MQRGNRGKYVNTGNNTPFDASHVVGICSLVKSMRHVRYLQPSCAKCRYGSCIAMYECTASIYVCVCSRAHVYLHVPSHPNCPLDYTPKCYSVNNAAEHNQFEFLRASHQPCDIDRPPLDALSPNPTQILYGIGVETWFHSSPKDMRVRRAVYALTYASHIACQSVLNAIASAILYMMSCSMTRPRVAVAST